MFSTERKVVWWKKAILLIMVIALPFIMTSPRNLEATDKVGEEKPMNIIILNYHKVEDKNISLSVNVADFDAQMAYLQENNFHTISPEEFCAAMNGTGTLPENPVMITFDDGYFDNYTNAYPILKKYGFKAVIFVITSFMDQGNMYYFTWDQAKEMEQNGISIESHTVSHQSMTELTDEQLRFELAESKKRIETMLGKTVSFVAYPTGTYNLHIAQLVKEAGYKGAFTIKYGNVDQASNMYALERIPIFHTANTFQSFLERIQYIPIFERLGWIKT